MRQLGGTSADEDGQYVLGDDALACLRDLKRWLKLYDEKLNRLDVARCLGEAKLVTGDLLPILASWRDDGKGDKLKARVALACLELMVPLTWPLENPGEMTINHHRHTPFLQQAQVLYKAGVMSWDSCSILRQVVRIGLPSIALPREDRTPRDEGIIKLVLYFLRNVAVIRQVPNLPSQGLEMEVSRSATVEAFQKEDVFAVLLTMCSNMGDDFSLQDVVLLEILFNLIKGINVKKLWMTKSQRVDRELDELKASLAAEKHMLREAKKNAPTRHGRFGTMIWIKREDEKMSAVSGQDNILNGKALSNMDRSKKWSKPQGKQKDTNHTIHDFNRFEDLTDSATEKLRTFAEEFLDSGFNPLFTHLRKAIEREADRLLDVNYRQFFYTVAWFLEAERTRREKKKREAKSANLSNDTGIESYTLVAAVLNQETFITLNRYMQSALDSKDWQDLNACMRCFTQILLTVQEMAQSPLEEDQEIAENIQNRIFYEEITHDRICNILKGYKDQGFGYLDACTELSHVFLRMLERYSKENVDLQVRSRRRARRKKKQAQKASNPDQENADGDEESEVEEHVDTAQVSKERKFDFNRFAAKFISQSSVDTFIALLAYYNDLSIDQLKRCHRFFYRVAFKQDFAVLLYRVDITALFYKMMKGPDGLDTTNAMYKDYSEFSRQLFKKMLKKLEDRPELMVEMLFSKIHATLYYLEFGKEKQTVPVRAPIDLEVRPAPGRDIREQIGIVVTALANGDKAKLIHFLEDVLVKAIGERRAWEAAAEARKSAAITDAEKTGEELQEIETGSPPYITVRPIDEETKTAMFKHARFKLLMRLCGFSLLGGEDVLGAPWIVPAQLNSVELSDHVSAIEQYETTPWTGDHTDDVAEDMLRRVRQEHTRDPYLEPGEARRDAFISDDEGTSDLDNEAFLFPDNIRKPHKGKTALEQLKEKRRKRKRDVGSDDEIDDALLDERRKKRKEANDERRSKIKSELYVQDSDDEDNEEKDREFFERERAGRKRQEDNVKRQMAVGTVDGADEVDRKKTKRRKVLEEKLDDAEDVLMQDMDGDAPSSSQTAEREVSDEEAEDEETPLSSQSEGAVDGALKEMAQTRSTAPAVRKGGFEVDDDNEDDDEQPLSTARRRVRAGFIVDSDDDE